MTSDATHMFDSALTDEQRFPLITPAGIELLRRLEQHPHAPRYNYRVGDRLTAEYLDDLRRFAGELRLQRSGWRHGELPDWLVRYVEFCLREAPFYRRYAEQAEDFFRLPTLDRESIRRAPWEFVPDSRPLEDLVVYTTSGTTGTALRLPSHPIAPAKYLPLFEFALAAHGVQLVADRKVLLLHVCAQLETYCFPSVMSYFDSAGFAKVNLLPHAWRELDDRTSFLNDCNPALITGDPVALVELASMSVKIRPQAIISSGAALLPAAGQLLARRFTCPVIDIYSLNEAGPVAYSMAGGHEIFPHNLYVEILREDGSQCQPGERGEVALTGGLSPNLLLLRYRTGDFAAMDFSAAIPQLNNLAGRPPVVFVAGDGRNVHSVDVTIALRDCRISRFRLHQYADGRLDFSGRCDDAELKRAMEVLRNLFGPASSIAVSQLDADQTWRGKPIQYSSECTA
jgi:phenylacetate-CoA ligase